MTATSHKAAAWIYRGIWGVLVGLFRVPAEPPALPVASGGRHDSFRPSDAYLRYLKFKFWVILALVDGVITLGWIIATAALLAVDQPIWAGVISLPALAIIVLPEIVAYIGIHLTYDTTWYVLTDRSLRIRQGLWIIREVTITFENVQNVTVEQGPLERYFGIASVLVETAGGGGGGGKHPNHAAMSHQGMLHGLSNAPEIRDLILSRVRASVSAGLGDEHRSQLAARASAAATPRAATPQWSPEHLAALRAIRDELRTKVAPA